MSASQADRSSNVAAKYRVRAEEMVVRAESALKRKTIEQATFVKYDEACFYYYYASFCYKAAQMWKRCAECLHHCSDYYGKQGKLHEAALMSSEAGDAYEKFSSEEAVKLLQNGVALYSDVGLFDLAARLQRRATEINERLHQVDEAVEQYRVAGQYFHAQGEMDNGDECLLRSAKYAARLERFRQAAQLYETAARSQLTSNLSKFNAADSFFRSLLCLFACKRYGRVRKRLPEFCAADCRFATSPERQFIEVLFECLELGDLDMFADHVFFFDDVRPLDTMKLDLLKHVQRRVQRRTEVAAAEREFERRKELAKFRGFKIKEDLLRKELRLDELQREDSDIDREDEDVEDEDSDDELYTEGAGRRGEGGDEEGKTKADMDENRMTRESAADGERRETKASADGEGHRRESQRNSTEGRRESQNTDNRRTSQNTDDPSRRSSQQASDADRRTSQQSTTDPSRRSSRNAAS